MLGFSGHIFRRRHRSAGLVSIPDIHEMLPLFLGEIAFDTQIVALGHFRLVLHDQCVDKTGVDIPVIVADGQDVETSLINLDKLPVSLRSARYYF